MRASDQNTRGAHWDEVYMRNSASAMSWFRDHLEVSIALLQQTGLAPTSRVIDVGGGASTLVDDLLDLGVANISVLDLSAASLAVAQGRLGAARAAGVAWLIGDITRIPLSAGGYTHWHDRAVLHFLGSADDIRAYAAQATRAVVAGGHAIVGGFAPDGPERCSGLPVVRRSAQDIAEVLGAGFALVDTRHELHRTPGGADQAFVYAVLRRV